jgi:hypothetical protein
MRGRRFFIALHVITFLIVSLSFIFCGGCKKSSKEQHAERAAPQASPEKEENAITLARQAQEKGGIIVSQLRPVSFVKKVQAYGTVLQLQNLTDIRNGYARAKTQGEKALTNLDFSKKEYERLKALNEDNKNVSDKTLEAAWSALHNAEENVRASREALVIMEDTAHQQWGGVIAQWMLKDSPALRRLLQQEEVLIRLTLPAGARITRMPENISLLLADGSAVSASFVSLSPRTDPHIQGISLFYKAPPAGKLLAGMNVTAEMPSSGTQSGFFVPASAVIWLQDKAWVYIKKSETGFSRVEVPVSNPLNEGYFVSDVFSSGDRLVVKGAQALLSEESMPKTTGGGEEDEGDED